MNERDYPTRPFVGVGVVVWRGDEVLLIQRGKGPRKGQWSIPGGMQEVGETAREAGVREVREETGANIEIDALVDVVDTIIRDKDGAVRTHYTLVDYVGRWIGGSLMAGDDAQAAVWAPYTELLQYGLWAETLRIIEAARKLRNGAYLQNNPGGEHGV